MTEDAHLNRVPPEDSPFWERLTAVGQLVWSDDQPDASPAQRVKSALERLRQIVPFDAATVYFYDPKKEQLIEGVSIEDQVELIDFLSIGGGSGLSGWTVHDRRSLLLPRREARDTDGSEARYQTFLSVPILFGERIYGALNMGCRRADALRPVDVKLTELSVAQLACLIRTCEDEARIARLQDKLDVTLKDLGRARRGLDALDKVNQAARTAREAIHQINDPLSVVLGNVQCLIAEKGAVNQKALSRMRRIEKASLRISEVSRRLLEIRELDSETGHMDDHEVTNAIC